MLVCYDNEEICQCKELDQLNAAHPQLVPAPTKAINKIYVVEPNGFANGISAQKYVSICRVSRTTAYRELTALCEMGVLVQKGAGGAV